MRKTWLNLLVVLFIFIVINEVFADTPPYYHSYQRVVGDGKYVFVMLYEHSAPLMSSPGKQYPSSGMYLADGSNVPIWTVDWYELDVFVSSDGEHLVRIGPWPLLAGGESDPSKLTTNLQQLAVAFYERGKLLKKYAIADLIKNTDRLQQSLSHFQWQKDIFFDETLDKLTIVTLDDQKYIFDVKTGDLE